MKFLQKYGEWVRWILAGAVVAATQLADFRYVKKTAYEADRESTRISLVDMRTSIALLQQTEKTQFDHEQRLRALERNRSKASYEIPAHPAFSAPDFAAAN